MKHKAYLGFLIALAAVVVIASGLTGNTGVAASSGTLQVVFLDVGTGDCIWIRTPAGKNILIDGGDGGSFGRIDAYPFIKQFFTSVDPDTGQPRLAAGSTIDFVFLSHPHSDHYGGLSKLLNDSDYTVGHVFDSGGRSATGGYGTFVSRAKSKASYHLLGEYLAEVNAGKDETERRVLDLREVDPGFDEDIELVVHHVYGMDDDDYDAFDWHERPTQELNNASLVLKLTYGEVSFLFTGDAEGKVDISGSDDYEEEFENARTPVDVERFLLEEEARGEIELASTVLKVGHHGSESSSSVDFILSASPKYLVISSGLKEFGPGSGTGAMLPKNSTVRRIGKLLTGEKVRRTDRADREDWLAGEKEEGNEAGDDNVVVWSNGMLSGTRIGYVSNSSE